MEQGATARYRIHTFKAARNCSRKRVDEIEVGGKQGTPGLGLSGDRCHTSALDSACAPVPSGWTPAPRREAAKGRECVPDPVPEDALEVEGQQPLSSDSSTEVPDSPLVYIRLPSSPPPFGGNCAPSQVSTLDSGQIGRESCRERG